MDDIGISLEPPETPGRQNIDTFDSESMEGEERRIDYLSSQDRVKRMEAVTRVSDASKSSEGE